MSIKSTVAGALAPVILAIPSLALAQVPFYPPGPPPPGAPPPPPPPRFAVAERGSTQVSIVPPAYGSVYVYEGRRLLGRLDGPGVLWLPTGPIYHVVAMRGDQVVWRGDRSAAGVPIELRWPAPRGVSPRTPCPYAYPSGPLTPPVELGRERTPY